MLLKYVSVGWLLFFCNLNPGLSHAVNPPATKISRLLPRSLSCFISFGSAIAWIHDLDFMENLSRMNCIDSWRKQLIWTGGIGGAQLTGGSWLENAVSGPVMMSGPCQSRIPALARWLDCLLGSFIYLGMSTCSFLYDKSEIIRVLLPVWCSG